MEPKDRIIVALDVPDLETAKPIVQNLAPHVGWFKVGLEFITAVGGPAAVALIKDAGCKVMYDAKFHDIPATMAGAARSVARLGVDLFTLHASAGSDGVRAAIDAGGAERVIGVTVLTTFSDADCVDVYSTKVDEKVHDFATSLVRDGARNIVCSPLELEDLKGVRLRKITPGVRPSWAAANDQKRAATPSEAILAGAELLVIGRPILKPPAFVGSPVDAVNLIIGEIAQATGGGA